MAIKLMLALTTLLVGGITALASCSSREPSNSIETQQQSIIGGTAPTKGALMNWGVVSLSSGCSGVLLTNRHVLTAHHCIRDIEHYPFDWYLPITVTLEKPSPQIDESATATSSIEHGLPWTLENLDYGILTLDTPLSVNGIHDGFFRGHYLDTDSSLLGRNVFCAGYGMTTLATFASGIWTGGGNYILTSSTQTIDDVWTNGTLIRRRHNGIVGAGGDSGSPCFVQSGSSWLIAGIQSNCPDLDWVDFNNPGAGGDPQFDWSEATAVRECRGPAPSAFHSWIANNIFATVTVSYDALPPLSAGGAGAVATVTTSSDPQFSIDLFQTSQFDTPRSGGIDIDINAATEPSGMMCTGLHATAPMSGSLEMNGRCLSDALVVAMLD